MKRRVPDLSRLLFLLSIAATVVLGTGCGSENGGGPAPCATCADEKVQQANQAMENVLFAMLNGPGPTRPDDMDFTAPHNLYNEAHELDSSNPDARLGLAVTGLLALFADEEVNAAFDEWAAYLGSHTPFEVPTSSSSPMGVPLFAWGGSARMAMPFDLVQRELVANARTALSAGDPQLSRVQAILRERVIPNLAFASELLAGVVTDPGYQYVVTPKMQGDLAERPREIDRADLLALESGCELLTAACRVAVAYDLNFAAYDSAGLVTALQPGSGWMALRPDGAGHMNQAWTDIIDAINHMGSAMTALLAESDDQTDDVIKIGPGDIERADVESLLTHLPDAIDVMENGYTLTEDWDLDPETPETALTIRPGALLVDPVEDWKALYPDYSVFVVRRPLDTEWVNDAGTDTITVTFATSGYHSASCYLDDYGGGPYSSFSGDTQFQPRFTNRVQSLYDEVAAMPDWAGHFYANAGYYDEAPAGTQVVTYEWSRSYERAASSVYIPVIRWDAASFEEWTWPDPTLGGLLPDMGSTEELMATFGVDASGWSRDLEFDWTIFAGGGWRAGGPGARAAR